jgi:hypothetical protein
VEDAAGFYEAPYSLILSGGAVVGMSFGALVRRPSFVNGAPVLDWNCF